MAFDFNPGHGYEVTLQYNGRIDPASDPKMEVSPAGSADMRLMSIDRTGDTATAVVRIDHNGSEMVSPEGAITFSVIADGDPALDGPFGEGVTNVTWSDKFNALGAPGATSVGASVGPMTPTPPL